MLVATQREMKETRGLQEENFDIAKAVDKVL